MAGDPTERFGEAIWRTGDSDEFAFGAFEERRGGEYMQVFIPTARGDAAREHCRCILAFGGEQRVEAVIPSEVAATGRHQGCMPLAVRIDEQYAAVRRACLAEHSDQAECNVGGRSALPDATLMIRHDEYASHCPTLHLT